MSIMLKNVRLSFPSLFQTEKFGGEDTGKFAATFILSKKDHAKEIESLKAAINEGIKTELKGAAVPADKVCLKDGDLLGRPEYADSYVIKATTKRRATVIDRDKAPLVEEDGRPYSGCYVNAMVDFWYQNNTYGKRVNANLLGVQFVKDGESFGGGHTDVSNAFDEVEDEDCPF